MVADDGLPLSMGSLNVCRLLLLLRLLLMMGCASGDDVCSRDGERNLMVLCRRVTRHEGVVHDCPGRHDRGKSGGMGDGRAQVEGTKKKEKVRVVIGVGSRKTLFSRRKRSKSSPPQLNHAVGERLMNSPDRVS